MRASTTALQVLLCAGLSLALSIPRQENAGYQLQTPPLDTPWTAEVGTNPWPQYPRPLLQRSQWQSLNGVWTYQNGTSLEDGNNPPFGQTFGRSVLVPSCLESGISGIQGEYMLYSWYQTTFTVPSNWTGERTLINFGAVRSICLCASMLPAALALQRHWVYQALNNSGRLRSNRLDQRAESVIPPRRILWFYS